MMNRRSYIRTPEIRAKTSRSLMGHAVTQEQKDKYSKSRTGKKLSQQSRENISKGKKGKKRSVQHNNNWIKSRMGHYVSEESKEKMSKSHIGLFVGEKSPLWRGGYRMSPYSREFNRTLKRKIRERDHYQCAECGKPERILGYKLHIHHVDYNKSNNNEMNLISLCMSCHSKTNFTRESWKERYRGMINVKH